MRRGVCQLFSKSQHTLDPFLLLPHGVNLLTGPGEAGSATRPASTRESRTRVGPTLSALFPSGFKHGRWRPLVAHRHHASPHLLHLGGSGFQSPRWFWED